MTARIHLAEVLDVTVAWVGTLEGLIKKLVPTQSDCPAALQSVVRAKTIRECVEHKPHVHPYDRLEVVKEVELEPWRAGYTVLVTEEIGAPLGFDGHEMRRSLKGI